MYTIYLFIHINTYIYNNCSQWLPSEPIQRAARFLLVLPHFSQSFFSDVLIDVLCKSIDAPTEITYVLGLLLLHILRTLATKRIVQWRKVWRIWWPEWCCVLREMIRSPNFVRKNDKYCSVTWQLAPYCWN